MKRFFILAMVAAIFAFGAVAHAEDLGVQIIGGESSEVQSVSLEDMKIDQVYMIDGYAKIVPVTWRFDDIFYQYEKGHAGDNQDYGGEDGKNVESGYGYNKYRYINIMKSGANADFAWLEVDLTNLSKESIDFTQMATVKLVYDDEYEFAGWVRMFNYNYDTYNIDKALVRTTLDPEESESTDMMYTAHLIFGGTLPNAVVEDKAPLRMEINLGGHELTYHIRK